MNWVRGRLGQTEQRTSEIYYTVKAERAEQPGEQTQHCETEYETKYGKCTTPTKGNIYYSIHSKKSSSKGTCYGKWYLKTEGTDTVTSSSHLWSQHSPDSLHETAMKTGGGGGIFFPALISRSSSERGSMDFRHLRLCKRIVLRDRSRLWRQSACRPLAAARNSKAGLSAVRSDEICWARLFETDRSAKGCRSNSDEWHCVFTSQSQPHQNLLFI